MPEHFLDKNGYPKWINKNNVPLLRKPSSKPRGNWSYGKRILTPPANYKPSRKLIKRTYPKKATP